MDGYLAAWFDSTTVTGNDRELLRAICKHASSEYGICIASQRRLAWDIGGVRRQTVNASLARLVDWGYVEKVGVTDNDTLMLLPCLSRPADRVPYPPDPCPESGQPLFPTNRDGSPVLTPVRKADMSDNRTQSRDTSTNSEQQVSEGEEVETISNPTTARARNNLSHKDLGFEFDQNFWPAYPRKVSKAAARRAFIVARGKADLDEILDGLGRSIAYWQQTGRIKNGKATEYVPHGATWLNGECWGDELELAESDGGMADATGSTEQGRKKAEDWARSGS